MAACGPAPCDYSRGSLAIAHEIDSDIGFNLYFLKPISLDHKGCWTEALLLDASCMGGRCWLRIEPFPKVFLSTQYREILQGD